MSKLKDKETNEFFSTHPSSENRISKLQNLIPAANKLYMMNQLSEVLLKLINKKSDEKTNLFKATCPHDCPDACSMEVEIDEVTKKVMKVSGENLILLQKVFCAIKSTITSI